MLDQFMSVLGEIITVQFVFFCLMIVGLVKLQRVLVESLFNKFYPAFIKTKFWTEFLITIAPIGTGIMLALIMKNYDYPEFLKEKYRVLYGVGSGLFSGMVYKIIKKTFGDFLGSALDKIKPQDKE